jgi:hypothetical protein
MINEITLLNEASEVARELYGPRSGARTRFTRRLLDLCKQIQDKDVLVIHNPGGWGSSRLDRCLEWERSIVEGVKSTVEGLGYSPFITQYFRSGDSLWAHLRDSKDQVTAFFQGHYSQAKILAAELKLIDRHLDDLTVIMVGVSQGAGFTNAVMRQLEDDNDVYSIELGTLFLHMRHRRLTNHTLAIDGNGELPDPIVHRNLWLGARVYATAPLRWLKYRLMRKPRSFTRCIDLPGHDYNWDYPGVKKKIEGFLETMFDSKSRRHYHETGEIH